MREIEFVLVGRRVRTMVETELAVVAFVDHVMMVGRRQFGDVALTAIDPIEQAIERRAQIETAAATVADFKDPQRFFF